MRCCRHGEKGRVQKFYFNKKKKTNSPLPLFARAVFVDGVFAQDPGAVFCDGVVLRTSEQFIASCPGRSPKEKKMKN